MSRQQAATDTTAAGCCPPVTDGVLSAPQAEALSRVFKALADPVRLRLLSMIATADGGEACVCELTGGFDVSGPTISHHLKVLRGAGLVEGERRGTWIYYRALPDALQAASTALVPAPWPGPDRTGPGFDRARTPQPPAPPPIVADRPRRT